MWACLNPACLHKWYKRIDRLIPGLPTCATISHNYCLVTKLCIEGIRQGRRTRSSCRNMDHFLTTSVLIIDGSKNQRTYWADQLKRCSPGYVIVEASNGQLGLDLFRSRQIDCVVLELGLPDQSGIQTLVELVSSVSRPQVAVIVLTHMPDRGISELASQNGAYASFVKRHTTGEDLDRAIQRGVSLVGHMNDSRQSTNTLTASS